MKHADKLLHATLSLVLAIGLTWVFQSFFLGALTAAIIGIIWEFFQTSEPGKSWNRGNTFDLVADGVGLAIGTVISIFIFNF